MAPASHLQRLHCVVSSVARCGTSTGSLQVLQDRATTKVDLHVLNRTLKQRALGYSKAVQSNRHDGDYSFRFQQNLPKLMVKLNGHVVFRSKIRHRLEAKHYTSYIMMKILPSERLYLLRLKPHGK